MQRQMHQHAGIKSPNRRHKDRLCFQTGIADHFRNMLVRHSHRIIACAAEVVIPYTSAHSRKMKMSIMVEEGVRRLRNGARGLDWERSRSVMELWSRKLRRSGYPATMRHEMIGASVRRFEEMCAEEDRGGRPVHRSRDWKVKERQRLKEMKKSKSKGKKVRTRRARRPPQETTTARRPARRRTN